VTKVLVAKVLGTSAVAVIVALVVVDLTRPSDAELRRDVAMELGVPSEVLELPVVDQVLGDLSDRSRDTIAEELRTSLLLGGAAGGLTAIVGAMLAGRHFTSRHETRKDST
jgi:hypothetical protein